MINNITDKIALIVDECLKIGYDEEAVFIASKYFESTVFYSDFDFIEFVGATDNNTDRSNCINYFCHLSADLTEYFKIGYDVFISYYLIYDVLNLVYSESDLNVVDMDKLSYLLEVTDKLNWSMISKDNFNKVVEVLQTVLLNYLSSLVDEEEVTKLNSILSSYWSYCNYSDELIVLSADNKFIVNTAEDFDTFELLDNNQFKSDLEDFVNSLEYEDIQLIFE